MSILRGLLAKPKPKVAPWPVTLWSEPSPALAKVPHCRAATSPVLRDPVVHKNHIEVRGHHSDFAALRHDVLKSFKGASFYKVPHHSDSFKEGMSLPLSNVAIGSTGSRSGKGDTRRDAVHKSERSAPLHSKKQAEGAPLGRMWGPASGRCIAMRHRVRADLKAIFNSPRILTEITRNYHKNSS